MTLHSKSVDWLELTIQRHFWHPGLQAEIQQQLKDCQSCAHLNNYALNDCHDKLAPSIIPGSLRSDKPLGVYGDWSQDKSEQFGCDRSCDVNQMQRITIDDDRSSEQFR